MAFQITFQPSNKIIFSDQDESVLSAAIHQGVNIPYGCRNGACGACKAKILSGQVHYDTDIAGLSSQEIADGYALLCCAKPDSDIQVECRELSSENTIMPKIFPVRVEKLERLSSDVIAMFLKVPVNQPMHFFAGQYIEFILKDGSRRAFSMANPPHSGEMLELHLRHVPGGKFTDYVFNELQEKTILRIEGPFGSFYLRNEIDKPIIFVAGGTGFAPIKSIIEDLIFKQNLNRPMHLYWGARTAQDLYMANVAKAWANHIPNFSYIPVLSCAENDLAWSGRRGFVHQAVLEDIQDFTDYQVYCCGAPEMVKACLQGFTQQGLSEQDFFADSFNYAASPSAA